MVFKFMTLRKTNWLTNIINRLVEFAIFLGVD